MRGILSGTLWTVVLAFLGFSVSIGANIFAHGFPASGSVLGAAVFVFGVGAVIAFAVWSVGGLLGVFLATIFFGDSIRQARWFWPLVGAVLAPLAVFLLAVLDVPFGLMPLVWVLDPLQRVFEEPVIGWDLGSLSLLVVPIYAAIGWRAGVRFRGPWVGAVETSPAPQTSPHKM